LSALPPDIAAQAGKVLRFFGGTHQVAVGDASTIECTTDPDGQGPDSDPYGIANRNGAFYVADAAGNDIVKVHEGDTSLVKVLSTDAQPVPTSLAFGPDGALYIGTLDFEGGPGGAAVYRLDLSTNELSVYASGLTAVTSLAFGRGGTLYVTEWTTGFDEATGAPSPNGDVVAIPWGGGTDGRTVLGAGELHFPTGVGLVGSTLYVSNWGIAPGEDTTFGPGNHGQLVSLSLEPSH
jgi:SMP-30/Gluconolactonase/LRE-like region